MADLPKPLEPTTEKVSILLMDGDYMSDSSTPLPAVSELNIPLERDVFLRTLLGHLDGTLQKIVLGNRACPFAEKERDQE